MGGAHLQWMAALLDAHFSLKAIKCCRALQFCLESTAAFVSNLPVQIAFLLSGSIYQQHLYDIMDTSL